ncbi:hypothetical protein XA68_10755 [Ophiocordyceps unilateralis]|uniref:G-patch domain-containing protein n=1 Tax=Ophiocordyceps unilateralis TaxID=268505 RepID=A0A2A9NYA5_OPHUN|nr:hypothetical protein XA68_10755 [Ophiocordyceps unilateralis]
MNPGRRGNVTGAKKAQDGAGEGDDYMNMTFDDAHLAKESSLQRSQRLKRESQARGYHKSKARMAAEEAEAREKALSTSLLDNPRSKNSKGLAMMTKMGFTGGGLGSRSDGTGLTEPIKLNIKDDRGGIGLDSEKKRRLDEAVDAKADSKAPRVEAEEYRARARKGYKEGKLMGITHSAQHIAERLDNLVHAKAYPPGTLSRPPLKDLPVVYRGIVRRRELKHRDQEARRKLEQSLTRLPTYVDDEADDDDRMALGQKQVMYEAGDELDEDDDELLDFLDLGVRERFQKVVDYLREKHRYCFFCKMAYEDDEMTGCPGGTEEDHD